MGVIREPVKNAVIDLHVEYDKNMNSDGIENRLSRTHARYNPCIKDLIAVLERAEAAARAGRTPTEKVPA